MRKLRVGLTGTLGAGKSTALRELARLGASTASADEAAHRLSRPGGRISRAVLRAFGAPYLTKDGAVDRPALARLVFGNPAARRRLERLTHPLIIAELRREAARGAGPVAVIDAPLLFEAGMAKEFDVTVSVSAPKARALERLRARDGMTPAQAARRMRAQWPQTRKEAAADVVWRNAGRRSDFVKLVRQYYRAWDLIARSAQNR
ncbi:MAG: dephospho-CoA kinase [Elusimicrobia bacterium]|nr:dephospho-CoA kinase [Elusimicrobiota bacterium]